MKMTKRGIILVIMALCLAVAACAETAEVTSILGEIKDDTYENAMLGIGCKMEGWHYYSDEEIAQMNQMTKERLGEEMTQLLEAAQNVNIMTVQSPDNMKNVNIQVSNVESNVETFNAFGLNAVAQASLGQFKQSLEMAGASEIEISAGEVSIDGQTFTCIEGKYILNGIQLYFKQPWILCGNYMATVTATSALTDSTEEILSNFYVLQ